jgi:hypothetical protein
MEQETSIGQPLPTVVLTGTEFIAPADTANQMASNELGDDRRAGTCRAGDKPSCGNDVRPDPLLGVGLGFILPALRSLDQGP